LVRKGTNPGECPRGVVSRRKKEGNGNWSQNIVNKKTKWREKKQKKGERTEQSGAWRKC